MQCYNLINNFRLLKRFVQKRPEEAKAYTILLRALRYEKTNNC